MFEPISMADFTRRTGIEPHLVMRATKVVSFWDLVPGSITDVHVMRRSYLEQLLRSVTLEGDPEQRPYENCEIELACVDPNHLVIGQTFVQRSKYQALIEGFGNQLEEVFCVSRGTAKCNALIMFGKTRDGEDAIAHYIPPIIEVSGDKHFLLDGIHRNFIALRVGAPMESVMIKGVNVPPPCNIKTWAHVQVVDEKPPRDERFYNLKPNLFRNLKRVGVDG